MTMIPLRQRWSTSLFNAASKPAPAITRPFSSSSLRLASTATHYEELGVAKNASKKDIQSKFYELSRIYHPDAPSTSTSDSIESRTSKFQAISQSYAVLSDDRARREYDSSLGSYSRPRYTSGRGHEPGNMRATWSPGENAARRERANYAWQHPSRRPPSSSSASSSWSASSSNSSFQGSTTGQFNPFARREGNGFPQEDHYHRFATRDARMRQQRAAAANGGKGATSSGSGGGSGFANAPTGIEGFGAKAEEESRLINDSGFIRSGQVFLVFGGTFIIASLFSAGSEDKNNSNRSRTR